MGDEVTIETDDAPPVLVERRDQYAVVTLNRPAKSNAISVALAEAFVAAIGELEDLSAIVLTGSGHRAFCAGIDLKERSVSVASWEAAIGSGRGHFWLETLEAMRRHRAVFIAAVNGVAVGGGLTLVNNCELAVSASRAEYGMPEIGFGAFPALAGPSTLRRVHPKHAAQLFLTGQRVDARTALSWGIVNEVVEDGTEIERASAIAADIARRNPVAVAYCKKGLRDLEMMSWSDGLYHGTNLSNIVKATTHLHSKTETGDDE